tara:strand:- start:34102 stop:35745 length:1644 start_codon:yes stop_codon:yes gene_type:complete
MNNNGLKMNKTTIAVAVGAMTLTGCSSTHTEKWNDIDKKAEEREVIFEDYQQQIIPETKPLSQIVNDFYVDTTPMSIIQEDKTSLPSIFHKKFLIFSEDAMKLTDFAADVYTRTGLSIDFIDNDKKTEEESDQAALEATPAPEITPYYNPSQQTEVEEIIYEDEKVEEAEDEIYIDHNGTLKQLLDLVTVKKGLKWKYDQDSNKIFVYKYDTKTFLLLGFGEEIEKKNTISTNTKTSNEGDDSSASSTNSQSISINSKTKYWENVKESVNSLVSSKGSVTFNDLQGKIVLTDNDFILSQVESLVDDLNSDAYREVTLKVEIINLTVTDKRNLSASLDIKGINDKLNVAFGNPLSDVLGSTTENSIAFSDGKTSAMLQMLDEIGKATVENNLIAPTLNNMPVPIQLTQNRTYIEQITTEEDSDSGDESREVEVGTVSEGITMTATPKAVGQNVLLDYSLNLSTIDSIDDAPGDVKIQLPITSTKNFVQKTNLRNGVPRIIATVERNVESAQSTHPLNENLWFLGGSEDVDTKKDILMVVVTPYITNLK